MMTAIFRRATNHFGQLVITTAASHIRADDIISLLPFRKMNCFLYGEERTAGRLTVDMSL
jgi:hypothetical protein